MTSLYMVPFKVFLFIANLIQTMNYPILFFGKDCVDFGHFKINFLFFGGIIEQFWSNFYVTKLEFRRDFDDTPS